ncbi:M1 family aminopeptidase [Aquimarina sp. AU474]|uniref:M1 family aminopeptidase n=1 Tax=Aquimarina sp. AU474 TaxID=2108529 RepID=UPI000D68AA61|nr:M1 family aminopeptidase [Aquimarina sp. AU474]
MKTIIFYDISAILKRKASFAVLFIFLGIGFITGFKFNISVGKELAVNAPYSVGFMIGLLSLIIILIATVLAFSLLFKEEDANFSLIIFSIPIKKKEFGFARFYSFYGFTLFGFFVLVLGYVIGLHYQEKAILNLGFHLWHFMYPFLIFGVINTLLVCSILFFIAQKFKNKLLVAITGLLLYVLYMITLMFSNAPFMAQALPQSILVQRVSALVDLFGLSGYFFEAKNLNVLQRNNEVVPFSNFLLINRLVVILFSMGMAYLGIRSFSFLPTFKKKSKNQNTSDFKNEYKNVPFTTATTLFNNKIRWRALCSFIKIDTIYIFKSIALVMVSILLVFYMGVEMFDDINKGVRLPQHYASSGLLAQTINSTFYFIGALIILYFVNDIFWRNETSRFSIIENTTYYAREKGMGHAGSITLLILYFTSILLLEAIIFQFIFKFPYFDWRAYFGVLVFNTLPLILFSLYLLFINSLSKNKTMALSFSILFFLMFATPIARSIVSNSLFRFLSGYNGTFSDFLGYGIYVSSFSWRLIFSFSIIGVLLLLYRLIKFRNNRIIVGIAISLLIMIVTVSSFNYLESYTPKDKEALLAKRIQYEKTYRKYQNIPQPTIKEVVTKIDLYPNTQSYRIRGKYIITNTHLQSIDSILISVPEDFEIKSLTYRYKNEIIPIDKSITELHLKKALLPMDSATLEFDISYKWYAVNGHDPFNAIIKNGSFMRVSRYFPQFGYDEAKEITDIHHRKTHELGKPTRIKSLDAPKIKVDDFIHLDMQISTPIDQIAVGTGELKKHWQDNERNYYNYTAEAIPFRFALSSAEYKVKNVNHKGVNIAVLYHPLHENNVNHLIENTKLTLDYCTKNFGPYPFESVSYAEVSSFTQGFAGTAYPGVIFMTENMTFNANIEEGNNQDVVNELAGHEVAHFWWGNNQIAPDYREGYAMLTESLAMYTEMMIYKKLYGKEKMMERVAIQQQIYDAQKGFNEKIPLIKATKEHPYLAYSKGAIVFVELSELIGEQQLNLALKNFLLKHKYPNAKPIASDLLNEVLKVADKTLHKKIKSLFN